VIIRESARRDESFEALRSRGAPSDAGQYPDADEAASVLLAAGGPVEMAYHEVAFL
jgi:type 2A phosphatase activator TIP41